MIQALLHGKLSREQENMEDLLTSNVFGLLAHVPLDVGLFPFLSFARDLNGRAFPIAELSRQRPLFHYWPQHQHADCVFCEPDLEIQLGPDAMIFVECKYLSGKSSEGRPEPLPPYDQLARQWDNLTHLVKNTSTRPILIYLTADVGCPIRELRASEKDYASKRPNSITPFECFWLSWRHLSELLRSHHDIIGEIQSLLGHLELHFFRGFTPVTQPECLTWKFAGVKRKAEKIFDGFTPLSPRVVSWKFGQRAFDFSVQFSQGISWRFRP